MSDDGNGEDNVCRDFLRNVCRRGASCKYKHPERSSKQRLEYQFCHDYQNSECKRASCKYIHCSRAEQEYYKETGKLPPILEDMVSKGLAGSGSDMMDGEIPVCRDYLKGECNRGSRCKFRHLSRGDMEYEERTRRMLPPRFEPRDRYDFTRDPYGEYEYDRMRRRPSYDDYDPYGERPPRSREPRDLDLRELEDENVMLRRKIDDLRKQVSDLAATNEVLLDQNARLRAAKSDSASLVKAETHLVRSTSSALPLLSHGNLTLTQQAGGAPTSTLLTQESPAALTDQIPGIAVSLAPGIPTVSLPSVQTSMISYPIVSTNIRPGIAGR